MPDLIRRHRARRLLLLLALIVGFLAGTAWLGAARGHADPSGSDWQITPTAGLQGATDSTGQRYPYVVLPTGGRWYLECPMRLDPGTGQLVRSIALNVDHDRCGNDQGATRTYPGGATWHTTSFASVNVDTDDVRCGQLVAHRADTMPADAVSQPFCGDRVLVYPTLNSRLANQLASWWPTQVLDTCPPPANRSSLACGSRDDGKGAQPLQWWHRKGKGVDCVRIPADHVPTSIAGWAGGDPAQLRRACQLMNNYFTGAPLSFAPSTDLLGAVRQALQEAGPARQPPWSHAVRGKDVKTKSSFGWSTVAGAVGGCLAGGSLGGLAGGPAGMVIGCLAGGAAGAAAANWLEGKDCALTSWHCIVNAITRWMANGFVSELKFGLNQLTHGLDPASLFGQDAFVRLWQAIVLISALLATLYALLSFGVAMTVLRPSMAMVAARNIMIWGWALAVALPFLKLVLAAVDGVTTFICNWGAGSSWTDLTGRFQSVMQVALVFSLPVGGATASVLLFVLLLIGGVAALFMAGWAFGRAAAIALAALGIPLGAAALTGPPALRHGPQMALSTLFGLIMFKPLTAIVFLLGIGLMGSGTSAGAFLVGILCVLGAAFAPWKIIRLFGAGIDHVSNGAAGHTAAVAGGTAAGALGARALYWRSRGLWAHHGGTHGSSGAGTVGTPAPAGAGAGAYRRGSSGGPGGPGADGGRVIPLPPRPSGGGGAGSRPEPAPPAGFGAGAVGSRVPTAPVRPPAVPGQQTPATSTPTSPSTPRRTASDGVARYRAGDDR